MSTVTTTAPSETTLIVRRDYFVPRERVFAAWLDAETLRRFFVPEGCSLAELTLEPKAGGAYAITMNTPNGEVTVRGHYLEIREPERIVFTMSWDGDEPSVEHESQVTLEFVERGAETELVVTHERLRNAEFRDNLAPGWTSVVENLATVL